MPTVELTESDFTLQDLPKLEAVIVLYKASWCHFCVDFLPLFNKLSQAYPKITFGIIDIDPEKKLVNNNNNLAFPLYTVKSFPTVVLYKKGKFLLELSSRKESYLRDQLTKLSN